MTKKRRYEASFKSKVVLEYINNTKSMADICSKYNIPATNLRDWNDILINRSQELFLPENERNKEVNALKEDIGKLHKIIGELTVENNYMKKKLMI